jgi:YebC/PmpR family DNA-binding regulatory protein
MPKFKNFAARKGVADQAKNNKFVKLVKQIIAEARKGGADPNANLTLKALITKAKQSNLPNDNIERALKKAGGDQDGLDYEEIRYEGYGPGGVAIIVDCLTDNRNRSAADIRAIFNKRGGNMGETGCVSWMFDHKGLLVINREQVAVDEDDMMIVALDGGAEDVIVSEDSFEILTSPTDFHNVKDHLENEGLPLDRAELTWLPKNTVSLAAEDADKLQKMLEAFDDHDDVNEFYVNYSFGDEE